MPINNHDIKFFDVGNECPDLKIEDGQLAPEVGLENSVYISLFTDRRVDADSLPLGENDPRGWWGDLIGDVTGDRIGSILWTLETSKVLTAEAALWEDAARQALEWMIEDGVAASIETDSSVEPRLSRINLDIVITRPDGENIPFSFAWDGQNFIRTGAT